MKPRLHKQNPPARVEESIARYNCHPMIDVNSGSIEINITQNQDTAVSFPYARLIVGKRHCRVLYIIPAQPELI